VLSDHTHDDGATIFRHACMMGLEGHRVKEAERTLSIGPLNRLAEDQESR